MGTIETNKETSKIIEITDIKDVSKIDLGGAKSVVDQVEIGGKMGKKEAMDNISKGQAGLVAHSLNEYTGLDSDVAISLIKNGELEAVCNNLEAFKPITIELQNLLIKKGKEGVVAKKVVNISNISPNEVANNLLKKGRFDITIHALGEAINGGLYKNLDDNIAYAIISDKNNIEYYVSDYNGFHFYNTQKNKYRALANNLKYFQDLDPKIAEILINKGQIEDVFKSIEIKKNIFKPFNQEFAEMLVNNGYIVKVADLIESFDEKGKKYIESKLIEKKYLKDSDGQRKQYESLDENELFWKKHEIIAITQLKKMVGFDNIKLEEDILYPKYSSGELVISIQLDKYKLPVTIYHEKGDINNIKFEDLDIKIENVEDATAILKTIIKILRKLTLNTRHSSFKYKKCKYRNSNVYIKRDTLNIPGYGFGHNYDEPIFKGEERFHFPLNDKKTMKELVNYINKLY